MILVDTSVLIDWSRGKDARLRALFPSLPIAVCGVTQAELLNGSRDPVHRLQLLAEIHGNLEVWARDPHFPLMQTVLPQLKLFQEPP